ncbi:MULTISPECIES: peptidylprolyl isomerase [Hyphomicrobiales]|jgi:peptidyl-prolyl cis-trans isomerase SurA|uniref:peptidylprolyl isomerase n=1 Tax=Hyphomicrobiales TaxID=356 RepID=UPI00037A856F|nr:MULTISPECIES: peptidylprolyl isomerase [Phyllobacteriaceae]MCX8569466.1 peptidylprolyl isomerase [Aminobacter sp. MET-1]
MRKYFLSAGFALLVAATSVSTTVYAPPAFASEIKYIVNDVPVTSYDIQRRAAFLKLQKRKGNAGEEMIDQTLRQAEMKRLGIRISDKQVDDAYARFAGSNKLKPEQMNQILAQAGVTAAHFKEYIRTQIGWNQALSARFRSEAGGGGTSEQDAVRRMLQQGGAKPSATEYMLQQVIFVVPASERGSIAKRKREADAMRGRFNGCEQTREFSKGLLDVTVRDLGRVLAPQLPPEWAEDIKKLKAGGVTPARETERGVEFIGVCSAREVSDDKVAQMVFQAEGAGKEGNEKAEELSKKYLAELRAKARIVNR